MTALPPGFRARPVRPEADVPAVLELCIAASVHDRGVTDVDERMVREAYSLPSFTAETDSMLVEDASGRAAAIAEYYDGESLHVAPYLFLRVLPEHRQPELLAPMLAWAAERAARNVSLAPDGSRVGMHTDLEAGNSSTIAALEAAGWHHDRTNWTMEIDLDPAASLPEPVWPEGITVRSADLDRDARAVHAAETDFFSDHYGFTPNPFEEWWHFRTRFFTPEPELWILAMDGEEIGGMALCSSQRPGEPDLGWISTLGVRRDWRRRGLALAILHHSFALLAAKGKRRAGLGVDAQSLTGATRLYEKAGMRVVREAYEYELVVREGKDLRTVSLEEPAATSP
ncbi:MAG TPA: GNAT family N-acetyltransferase [Candidatus Limnocylindria bacterium]|jgi:ribosomal protein S18 acetylase RimI-like enzyme|nr:GNAT family N-acetyltransferase [Candidatus Limnocylindria bacterium]